MHLVSELGPVRAITLVGRHVFEEDLEVGCLVTSFTHENTRVVLLADSVVGSANLLLLQVGPSLLECVALFALLLTAEEHDDGCVVLELHGAVVAVIRVEPAVSRGVSVDLLAILVDRGGASHLLDDLVDG